VARVSFHVWISKSQAALLAFGREVEKSGGDEVLEVALGGVMANGAVDNGLGGGAPGDVLKGGVLAKVAPKGSDGGRVRWRRGHRLGLWRLARS